MLSSMMLISTRPANGMRFPLYFATIALSAGSALSGKRSSRKSGLASSTIFCPRRHSLSRYGPVPTGFAIAQPLPSPYASTTSRATADAPVVVRFAISSVSGNLSLSRIV